MGRSNSMRDLYIAVLEWNQNGILEIANEKLDLSVEKHTYSGLEFKIQCEHGNYVQLSVYVQNQYTTTLLGDVDACGTRYGIEYDTPILFETSGGFAGVQCDYIFQISKKKIDISQTLHKIGIDGNQSFSQENYNQLLQIFYKTERITGFHEMYHYIKSIDALYTATLKMVQNTKVYDENFISFKRVSRSGKITYQENLTLTAAEPFAVTGKRVAVLNFANPVEEGGGVLRGATAQEENLCRSSNLYYALTSENAKSYYETNRNILRQNQFNSMFLGTDCVIYSPDVLILKNAVGYRTGFTENYRGEYRDRQYYNVDVATCAAPFFSGSGYILPNGDLRHLFERRIRNLFEVCIENDVEVLILGAFGCGAFHNPPDVVADAFRNVLLEPRYQNAFEQIVFAVKRSDTICLNIEAFERNFSEFPKINNNGTEKKHRLLWKWKCNCGFENHWDSLQCANCGRHRKQRESVILYK